LALNVTNPDNVGPLMTAVESVARSTLTSINDGYKLRYVESGSSEKYTSNAVNLYCIKGNEAVFEKDEGKKSKLIESNSYKLCDDDTQVSIALLGDNIAL